MEPRGLLIVLEGIDWCGKFTQREKTRDWLGSLGYRVAVAEEPNDRSSPIGIAIREMLKGEREKPQDPYEFQRLYVLDRAQNLFKWYLPFLEKSDRHIEILERYALSTIAYGMLSERPPEDFVRLHEEVIGPRMVWPDLTILLDLPAGKAIRRIAKARGEPEHFEKLKTLMKVRENYLKARFVGPFAGKVAVVNGEQTEDAVFQDVKAAIQPFLAPIPVSATS